MIEGGEFVFELRLSQALDRSGQELVELDIHILEIITHFDIFNYCLKID